MQEGARSSTDATYHTACNLTAYSDNFTDTRGRSLPIRLKASITSVLGNGVVLGAKVTPNDTHRETEKLLTEVYEVCKVLPKVSAVNRICAGSAGSVLLPTADMPFVVKSDIL